MRNGVSGMSVATKDERFFRYSELLSLILFGGKGGNGKTTSACATGLYLAQQYPNKRILVVSTDPAHSVGDSFDCTVG